MEMGKLCEEAANTAEASVTSFLSRNSAWQRTHTPRSKLHHTKSQVRKWMCEWVCKPYPLAHTASSRSHRTCLYQWWCCNLWNVCSCMVRRSQSPKREKETSESVNKERGWRIDRQIDELTTHREDRQRQDRVAKKTGGQKDDDREKTDA